MHTCTYHRTSTCCTYNICNIYNIYNIYNFRSFNGCYCHCQCWFDSNLWLWGDNIWHEVVKTRFWTEFPHRVTRRDIRVVTIRIPSIHSTSSGVSMIKLCWHATTNSFAIGNPAFGLRALVRSKQMMNNHHLSCPAIKPGCREPWLPTLVDLLELCRCPCQSCFCNHPFYLHLSTRSFRLLGHVSVARCAIARSQVPSAAGAEVLLGKMHPIDATSFGPKLHRSYAPPPLPGCTRSSDIFPVYALSQAINTAASCLVNVLLPKF